MTAAIAAHEWRRLRHGLSFWLLLALTQLLIAWLAFAQLEAFAAIAPQLKAGGSTVGATDLVVMPTANSLLLLLLLIAPLLAMGSLAGESHSGRLPLWLSSPTGSAAIALGKILGLWLGLLAPLLSACATLAVLGLGIDLDLPRLAVAVAGLALVALWLAALCVLLSGLFDHPAAALAASYGVLLLLWLLDSFSTGDTPWQRWALMPHVEPLLRGLLRSEDLLYFVSTGAAAALLTIHRLDRRRGLA
ncbi:MAG: ABC transporter permease subunit [Gammaproteobacteria bacterium]|nr:ABC transporter permease subunit [Gammaproteobacteria bacterium]